ncbi:MAG: FAD-dependent oxidoreductase [Capnocytophaga sp.]|nr:FAD-dependent oxidoreductase [Capnocytophaga sp.]
MTQQTTFKNIIIGFGKGGKTLAGYLAKQGESTAVIERLPKMYGGTCINVACIPTKSLITQAEKGIAYEVAQPIKELLTGSLREKNYTKLQNLGVAIIDGEASFITSDILRVKTNSEELTLTAERIFINTGTIPFIPDIEGIDGKFIYNSTTLMELADIPKNIAVVGGGFIGLEFSNMLLHFGCNVTLIDRSEEFLPKEDRDIADAIRQSIEKQGLKIISNTGVSKFCEKENHVDVHCENNGKSNIISADAVLIATGRTPETARLNLSAAGISTDKRGYINVNSQLKTDAPNVWAIGDVHGGAQFTYISLDDFRIIKNQLSGGSYNSLEKRKDFPTTVFLTPSYARIGINEREAREQNIEYRVSALPATAIPKAAILKQQEGILKALIDTKNGKILGCMLFCAEAHEMINSIKIAMDAEIPYTTLRDTIYTHPTMSEAFNDLFDL